MVDSDKTSKRWIGVIVPVLDLVVIILYPFETIISLAHEVQLIDETGKPLQGITAEQ